MRLFRTLRNNNQSLMDLCLFYLEGVFSIHLGIHLYMYFPVNSHNKVDYSLFHIHMVYYHQSNIFFCRYKLEADHALVTIHNHFYICLKTEDLIYKNFLEALNDDLRLLSGGSHILSYYIFQELYFRLF